MAAEQQGSRVPAWFWIVAALALLFELFGCYAYLTDVSRTADDIAGLPLDQRTLREVTPWWIYAAYGTAVWVGLAGAVLLLMRRRHAEPLLLVSLVAVVVQFGGALLVPAMRDSAPPNSFTLPIAIALVAYGLWHFARLARRRGWLR
jgi:hypothetical protein